MVLGFSVPNRSFLSHSFPMSSSGWSLLRKQSSGFIESHQPVGGNVTKIYACRSIGGSRAKGGTYPLQTCYDIRKWRPLILVCQVVTLGNAWGTFHFVACSTRIEGLFFLLVTLFGRDMTRTFCFSFCLVAQTCGALPPRPPPQSYIQLCDEIRDYDNVYKSLPAKFCRNVICWIWRKRVPKYVYVSWVIKLLFHSTDILACKYRDQQRILVPKS